MCVYDYHPFPPSFVASLFASPSLSVPLIFCQKAISVMANKRNRTGVADDRLYGECPPNASLLRKLDISIGFYREINEKNLLRA